MSFSRYIIGILFVIITPLACHAQEIIEQPAETPVLDRLQALTENALPLQDILVTEKERTVWAAETKRYAERSSDLRKRCREEIKKSNRDTIVTTSARCLRSDLLLEVSHTRNVRDTFLRKKGITEDAIKEATAAIDAWLDAATSIIDGIDAGVFTTVDTLKAAKKNLHVAYRLPMNDALMRLRTSQATAVASAIALITLEAVHHEYHPILDTVVPCIEHAKETLLAGARSIRDSSLFFTGTTELRTCIEMLHDAGQ